MNRLRSTALLLAALCVPLGASLGSPAAQEIRTEREVGRPIERLRARLSARPAEERVRLEHHLDEFERLPPEARARLLRRAQTLRARERAIEREVTAAGAERAAQPASTSDATTAIESAPHPLREQQRAHLREGFRQRGREVRARIPLVVQRWLERAPPEFRRRYLELLEAERELMSLRALAILRDRLGLPPDEVRRLERMPLVERLQAMRELREASRGRAAAAGERGE